jgi:predicted RNA-binding protein with PUA-like domain
MASGGGYNMWFYSSVDALSVVRASGYFNNAASMMNVGDVVFVYDNNAPTLGISVVLSNDGSTVDIADGTAITVTDTD